MPKKKVSGARGSWFAKVDGQTLPCVHKYWWNKTGYYDPNAKVGDRKFEELVAAITKGKRVILTADTVLNKGEGFDRTGYIAIYEVDNVEFDANGLRFEFKKRLDNLS